MKTSMFPYFRPGRGAFGLLLTVALTFAVTLPGAAGAQSLETTAEQAVLIDLSTDSVLFAKNADEQMPTSSMGKMATIYAAFRALDQGWLSLDDTFEVSEKAWRTGGSSMFLEHQEEVSVRELLQGIIVSSGNDASVVLAEGMAGSEEEFVNTLNDIADELGMDSTHFANASGWPDPDQYSTAMDLAILAEKTIENFPQYYHWYDRTEFTYNEITQNNRNPLLYEVEGADGLKTGHTQEAGYGLTGSVKRGDRRLIVVLNGLPSRRARATESERLIEWGFRNFDPVTVFEEGETVIDGKVWRGRRSTIPLVTNQEIRISIHRRDRRALNVTAIHHDPLPAPVEAGEQVGTLRISAPNLVAQEYPLFAGESVGPQGFLGRAMSAANYLVFGHSS